MTVHVLTTPQSARFAADTEREARERAPWHLAELENEWRECAFAYLRGVFGNADRDTLRWRAEELFKAKDRLRLARNTIAILFGQRPLGNLAGDPQT